LATVNEVNENKQTVLFKVNLDDNEKEKDSENLSDSNSNSSDEEPQELMEHKRYRSVNLPFNATVGQYSNIQSNDQF